MTPRSHISNGAAVAVALIAFGAWILFEVEAIKLIHYARRRHFVARLECLEAPMMRSRARRNLDRSDPLSSPSNAHGRGSAQPRRERSQPNMQDMVKMDEQMMAETKASDAKLDLVVKRYETLAATPTPRSMP
jgi:hypothetical protein